MSEPDFLTDRLGDGFTQLQKTGTVNRSERLNTLTELVQRLEQTTDKQLLYDIYYNGDPDFESIHYTEIFSHALLLTPCDDALRYDMVIGGTDDESVTPFDPSELLAKQLDKYRLIRHLDNDPIPAVVFLPGSNLLEKNVDWEFVYRLYKAGAKIKPHPITLNDWLIRIEESFPGAVYGNHVSGHDLLHRAETVYCTSASELGLLGKLMKKPVGLIDANDECVNRHIYRQLYEIIRIQPDPHAALCRLLASPRSGIVWLNDGPDKLDQVLAVMDQVHRNHYSTPSNLDLGVSYELQSEGFGFDQSYGNGGLGLDSNQSSTAPSDR